MQPAAISVRSVSKVYNVFDSPRARLLHAIAPSLGRRREVCALRDVSFEVRRGESLAVIGRNGGGKSTLLEILTGTLAPTSGEVRVNGRVSALLELGSGFNPEYTGRDNVILNGLLLGLARAEILRRFDEIAAFADIGDAIERPVKTYSSGMMMRLAFAVQVLTDPEILIIDEALSVGDFFFQQKCFRHIRGLIERGVTLLFVSHDMGTVRDLCSRGLFLRDGRVEYFGDNLEAIRRYLTDGGAAPPAAARETSAVAPAPAVQADGDEAPLWSSPVRDAAPAPGSKARILAVSVLDSQGHPTTNARIGSPITFRVRFRAFCSEPLHVNIVIRNRYDQVVTGTGSYSLRASPPALAPNAEATFELRIDPMLEVGNYSFTVSLAQPDNAGTAGAMIDETPTLGPLQLSWDYQREIPPFYGMVGLPSSARFLHGDAS